MPMKCSTCGLDFLLDETEARRHSVRSAANESTSVDGLMKKSACRTKAVQTLER
ncbi:UNVERIFIED_CONTAM: hypothetical protein GTU68_062044 [Idotea baltica]|nr:hypothetical protein [Idotea baltica]